MGCPKCGQQNKEQAQFCSSCGASLTKDGVALFEKSKEGSSPIRLGRKSIGAGLGAALIASVCCVVPLVALSLGIGGAGALLTLGKFRPYFIGASLLFLAVAIGIVLRRNERDGCCPLEEKRRNRFLLPLYVLSTYLVIFGLVTYFVTPRIYGGLDSKIVSPQRNKVKSAGGNSVSQQEFVLQIKGFTCPSCAAGVKSILSQKKGIIEANIETSGKAKILYDETKISQKEILKAIRQLGYAPAPK